VAFINYRRRLTKVLAGAARGKKGSKGGGGRVRLSNVDTEELAGFKDKLICHFKLAADMVGGDIWEFVNDMDGPAFLERELMGLGVDWYQ
jgi:hypothetical protein